MFFMYFFPSNIPQFIFQPIELEFESVGQVNMNILCRPKGKGKVFAHIFPFPRIVEEKVYNSLCRNSLFFVFGA